MKTFKITLILVSIVLSSKLFAQPLNLNNLYGKWFSNTNEVLQLKHDFTGNYKTATNSFVIVNYIINTSVNPMHIDINYIENGNTGVILGIMELSQGKLRFSWDYNYRPLNFLPDLTRTFVKAEKHQSPSTFID